MSTASRVRRHELRPVGDGSFELVSDPRVTVRRRELAPGVFQWVGCLDGEAVARASGASLAADKVLRSRGSRPGYVPW